MERQRKSQIEKERRSGDYCFVIIIQVIMKIKNKMLLLILACVCLLATGPYLINQLATVEVSAECVERRDIEQIIKIKGVIEGRDSAKVYSFNGKKVGVVKVSEGDRVTKGDTLCELVSVNDSISIEQAELYVESAQRDYENTKELYTLGTVTENDLKNAESALKQAELNLKNVKDGISILESPISGIVTRVNTKEGKVPENSDVLFVIEDIDELQMELRISDDDINLVKIGQAVRISTPIEEGYIYGIVEKIALTGEEKSLTSSDMVVPVIVKLDNKSTGVRAGVSGKAEIIVNSCSNVLSVPVNALLSESDGTYVYIVNEGILNKKKVTVLVEGTEYAAITDDCGIVEGDYIVDSPESSFSDGLTVRIN